MSLDTTPCCGVDFIDGIDESPKKIISIICEERYVVDDYQEPRKNAFMVFTDATECKNGKRLAKFIIDNKLGTVSATKQRRNPNSGNMIKIWIWTPNERNLRVWWSNN